MEELQETYADKSVKKETKKDDKFNEKNAKLAELYEDAAEYEEELEQLEKELDIIKNTSFENLIKSLSFNNANNRDFESELKNIVLSKIDEDKKREVESLTFEEFSKLNYVDEIKSIIQQHWELLIEIKKEHIKEEHSNLKIMGLKPHFVKKIYKQVNGLN